MYEFNCENCGTKLFSEWAPALSIFYDEVAQKVLCSEHQDVKIGNGRFPIHPRLAPKWKYKS